mmetsp:Transcript_16429/g.24638  ORF Transcript_16429/g.24638 Transcript_16429/m.24638 type:complete len:293 (-) Transcript_16429:183-1061(-)
MPCLEIRCGGLALLLAKLIRVEGHEDGLALALLVDRVPEEAATKEEQDGQNDNQDEAPPREITAVVVILVLARVVLGAAEKVAVFAAAEVVLVAGVVPRVAVTRLDGHLVHFPLVFVTRLVRRVGGLGVGTLAVEARVHVALVEARLLDEEPLAGLAHLAAAVPLVPLAVRLVEGRRGGDCRLVAARAVLPRVALGEVAALRRRGPTLVEVLELALASVPRGRCRLVELGSDRVVRVSRLEPPHGEGVFLVGLVLERVAKHGLTQVLAAGVDLAELGARVLPRRRGGRQGQR